MSAKLVLTMAFGLLAFHPFSDLSATEPCSKLLKKLWNYEKIGFVWLTNYQANRNWMAGYGIGELKKSDAFLHYKGTARRLWSDKLTGGGKQPFDSTQAESISIEITGIFSEIIFGDKYGPYDIACYGDKFMVIHTGDTVETLTFKDESF